MSDGLELDADGRPRRVAVVVDLDAGDDPAGAATPTAVLIGVARGPVPTAVAARLACTLVPPGCATGPSLVAVDDPPAAVTELAGAIDARPRAAVALDRLLRVAAALPVDDALAAESAVYSMLLAGGEFRRWLAGRPAPDPAGAGPAVRLTRAGDVLEVRLDRPARRNAFDVRMRDELVAALDLVDADPTIRRVDLRAAGPAFCAGGDLAEFGTTTDVSTAHLIRLDRGVAGRLERCRDRVVAHLHGACIGAGVEIPSFAGRVVARPDAWFRLPEVAMGLVPGAGGTVGITRRIGRWRTAYLALSGARLDARTARDWGLVDAVVDA